ncbi:MAG: Ig-like domain-containing protein [Gemmatimonadaceae bacterium]
MARPSAPRPIHAELHRTNRLTRWVAVLALTLLAACRSDKTTGPVTPSAVRSQGGSGQTGVVGTALTTSLAVLVTDAAGKPLSDIKVDWDAAAGAGTTNPSSSKTDGDGIARTVWTLGTVAGAQRVAAQVTGLAAVTFTATAIAGPATGVIATPDRGYLGVGDTLRIRAAARDQYGNDLSGSAIAFTTPDGTVASVSTTGLVTALTQGTARIIADASGRSDTVPVTVGPAGSSVCGPTPTRTLALGEVLLPDPASDGTRFCLTAPAGSTTEYALTLISTAALFSTVTPIDLYGLGSSAPTGTTAPGDGNAFAVAPAADMTANAWMEGPTLAREALQRISIPREAEQARRRLERRELAGLAPVANSVGIAGGLSSFATDLKVGDALTVNANANSACSNPDNRSAKVVAVGTRAVIVADNDNPSGGYSDAEYASIAATFDTLVYPIDTAAFGAPSNMSGSGKIILFYTKTVNALTPPSTNSYTIGGFFFARDLYPKTAKGNLGSCAGSNEAEMFYLLVPDPTGTINNNKRSKDEVTTLNLGTIAHEFQHLINAGRRLYVNTGAATSEETWLDEGLSHVAEELLYYRLTGFTSRQNLGLSQVSSQATYFTNYAAQNFSRLYQYLINPELNSPYAPNDSLATRGATWSFLRYVAGRQGTTGEAPFFRAVVNSTITGRANLTNAVGGSASFADYLLGWTVSLMADDFSTAITSVLDPRYVLPAWNFRSIYPALRVGGGSALGVYPINTRAMVSGTPQRISLAGGTSSYVRFALGGGRSSFVTLSTNGSALPTTMRYAVVRLK